MARFGKPKYLHPPCDKHNLIYIILLIHGIGTLLPWNMFITANDYFKYRVNATETNVTSGQVSNSTSTSDQQFDYTTNLITYIVNASKLPNILFQAFNFFFQSGFGSLDSRILVSIFLQLIVFGFTVALVVVDISVSLFFWLTIVSVAIINIFNGVYQNCLFGSVAKLPMKYTNALVIGTNVSGVFSSLISIISVYMTPSPTLSAMYYFATAAIYLFICLFTYLYAIRNDYYRYYQKLDDEQNVNKSLESNQTEEPVVINLPTIWFIFKQIWLQCLNILLIFVVSLSLFPAVTANVLPTGSLLSTVYFSKVACFLFFNLFSMIGNYASNQIPKISPKYLWIIVVARFAFIPAIILCNYQPGNPGERTLQVIFSNDVIFMMMVAVFGFTNGHATSLAMMYAPKCVELKYQPTAGMIASFCLMLGILLGGNLSILFPQIVNNFKF